MKKLLALILSMLLIASCFAMAVVAAEETTAAGEETTAAGEETTAAGEETTEGEAPNYSNTLLVFDNNAKEMKLISSPNGIHKAYFNSDWEGARLKIQDAGDPYVSINWSTYIKKAGLDKVDSQSYPYVVFKLKVEGYVDDFELFYAAGEISGATGGYSATTDWPCESSGEIEYIIYDLTGDCEGNYNMFRFDPMGADEDTLVYLYEMALFATEDEAIAYAGLDKVTEAPTTEEPSTEEPTTEEATKAPVSTRAPKDEEEEGGCGSVISIGAVVAIVALGAVCIKKKD